MSITPISAAGLGQYVLQASNSTPVEAGIAEFAKQSCVRRLEWLPVGVPDAADALPKLGDGWGTTLSSSSQLSTDLTALGTALTSGDLSTAQSAFATLQSDLKTSPSPAQTNETTAASQSIQLVQATTWYAEFEYTSSSANSTSALLDSVYGSGSSLNVLA
jgi:hypothetical protein